MVRPTLIVSSCRGPEETCNPYMKLVGNTGNKHGSSHPYSQFLQGHFTFGTFAVELLAAVLQFGTFAVELVVSAGVVCAVLV